MTENGAHIMIAITLNGLASPLASTTMFITVRRMPRAAPAKPRRQNHGD